MIALVALLVIGPERLPKVARLAGFWIGKGRHMMANVKAEIHAELQAEEMRQIFKEQAGLEELENMRTDFSDTADTFKAALELPTEEGAKQVKEYGAE